MNKNDIEKQPVGLVPMGSRGVQLRSLDDAFRFSKAVVQSGVAPAGDNPQTVLIKLQAGAELGIPPMAALSGFVVVNGRLSMMGHIALGKIRASGAFEMIELGHSEDIEETKGGMLGWVRFKRGGQTGMVTYTQAEAERAGLWMKKTNRGADTPWVSHPGDMLLWRAVGRFAKRYASDILLGFEITEIAQDFERTITAAKPIESTPAAEDPLMEAIEGCKAEADALDDAIDSAANTARNLAKALTEDKEEPSNNPEDQDDLPF